MDEGRKDEVIIVTLLTLQGGEPVANSSRQRLGGLESVNQMRQLCYNSDTFHIQASAGYPHLSSAPASTSASSSCYGYMLSWTRVLFSPMG